MPSRNTLAIVLLLAVLALAFQGTRPLWEPDEGRYTDVALEMVRLGDYLTPHLHHEIPHYTKPPLTYWTIAGAVRTFGRNVWATRLPSALAFLGVGLLLLVLGKRFTPDRPGLPPLIYGTMLLPFVAANVITTDSLLALWTGLAGGGFALWLLDGKPARRAVFLMWIGFGLAFLTKGPPGLVSLPAFLIVAGLVRGRRGLRSMLNPAAVGLFVILALTWFLVLVAHDRTLLRYFLVDETAKRIATGAHHRNPEWYAWLSVYGPTLLIGTLPWTLPFLRAARRAGRVLRALAGRRAGEVERADLLLTLWIVLPLTVFLLSRSRLAFYLLPLFMPVAILTAREVKPGVLLGTRSRALFGAWIVALLGLKLGAAFVSPPREDVPALAAAIREAATGPVREVVFVDKRPAYGLNFYLGAEVEAITMAATNGEAGAGSRPTLADELAESEPGRFFLLRARDVDRFTIAARERGSGVVARGGMDDLRFFEMTAGEPALPPGENAPHHGGDAHRP